MFSFPTVNQDHAGPPIVGGSIVRSPMNRTTTTESPEQYAVKQHETDSISLQVCMCLIFS